MRLAALIAARYRPSSSRLTIAWMPLLPSTSWVTCRSQARLQKTYASSAVQRFS